MVKHLACIMDGNRRWARKQGLSSAQGHFEGIKTAQKVMAFCKSKNIPYLSLYLFSLENFNRSEQERNFLFDELFPLHADEFTQRCLEHDIRVRFLGDRSRFPQRIAEICDTIVQKTEQCHSLMVDFLFCYGGQQEIVAAAQKLAQCVQDGSMQPSDITLESFAQSLWNYPAPSPDLIVRTGGMQRLSNFLLFQSAYAEIIIVDEFWPEVNEDLLERILGAFHERKRNFGV